MHIYNLQKKQFNWKILKSWTKLFITKIRLVEDKNKKSKKAKKEEV